MTETLVKEAVLFQMVRDDDATGVSGTGIVARGIEMVNGCCLMQWVVGPVRSIVCYRNVEDLILIHGHNGKTRVEYVDPKESSSGEYLDMVNRIGEAAVSLMDGVARMALNS